MAQGSFGIFIEIDDDFIVASRHRFWDFNANWPFAGCPWSDFAECKFAFVECNIIRRQDSRHLAQATVFACIFHPHGEWSFDAVGVEFEGFAHFDLCVVVFQTPFKSIAIGVNRCPIDAEFLESDGERFDIIVVLFFEEWCRLHEDFCGVVRFGLSEVTAGEVDFVVGCIIFGRTEIEF